jgi:hypothetical protein
MKVGEFQKELGITSTGYSRFMAQNGPRKGLESDTFWAAAEFFKRRELAGVKMPRAPKKAKTASSDSGNAAAGPEAPTKAKASSKMGGAAKNEDDDADVSGIHLDGEDNDSVPVYDTCDDIRTKISRFMRETPSSNTNSAFIRLINSTLPTSSTKTPTSRQMPTFLNKKGPTSGADSPVFYASYVFFEKLRIKKNKPKSKKRVEMEETWTAKPSYEIGVGTVSRDGMPLKDMAKQRFWLAAGSSVSISQLGEVSIY